MSGGKCSEMQGKRIETKGKHFYLFIYNPRPMICLLVFRERGRESGGNIDVIHRLPPPSAPTGGSQSQGRHVPWQRIRPATFQGTGRRPNKQPPGHGRRSTVLEIWLEKVFDKGAFEQILNEGICG